MKRTTEKIELVETHNITLSLRRILSAPGYDRDDWKRALYHALLIAGCGNRVALVKIREALELP